MELLSASRGFLKCNFHCHTTCSDGRLSPKDVMAAYRALDYDVLAITDHREVTRPAADEIPAGLTLIPGTELDFLLPTQAVHLLGLGVSPDIADCWNPNGTPQQAIDSIRACGGRAVLAHPAWSLNTTELMCSFRGLSGVEIFNSVSSVPTNALRGDSAAMLDPVFANGQLLNCFANDNVDFAFDNGLVCKWIKGQSRISPKIISYYNIEKNRDKFCKDIESKLLPYISDVSYAISAIRDLMLCDITTSDEKKDALLTHFDHAPAHFICDVLVYGFSRNFVKARNKDSCSSAFGVISSTRPILDGIVLKYQMCETGAASSIEPMRSRRTFARVTSTPQRSQTLPL